MFYILIYVLYLNFPAFSCSQWRCYCYVAARQHQMAMDNASGFSTGARAGGADGAGFDGNVFASSKTSSCVSLAFTF